MDVKVLNDTYGEGRDLSKRYTVDDVLATPEWERVELIRDRRGSSYL